MARRTLVLPSPVLIGPGNSARGVISLRNLKFLPGRTARERKPTRRQWLCVLKFDLLRPVSSSLTLYGLSFQPTIPPDTFSQFSNVLRNPATRHRLYRLHLPRPLKLPRTNKPKKPLKKLISISNRTAKRFDVRESASTLRQPCEPKIFQRCLRLPR